MLQLIANDESLGLAWQDHELKGEWQGTRECHFGFDALLLYQVEKNAIAFIRAGTHSQLFK